MKKALPNIIEWIKVHKGKDLAVFHSDFLLHSIAKREKATGVKTLSGYLDFLKEHPSESDQLINLMYNAHSEFFRDPLAFILLWKWILPSLFALKTANRAESTIRIWSAATATGQEAYSLAMLLDDFSLKYKGQSPIIQLFGSDIQSNAIKQAKRGVYREEHMQKVPFQYVNRYFYPVPEGFRLLPRIREAVNFFQYDLLDTITVSPPESIFGSFDLIYCSNLFIYYNNKNRNFIQKKLLENLVSGGYLIADDAEKGIVSSGSLKLLNPLAAIFYKEIDHTGQRTYDSSFDPFKDKETFFR